MTRPTGYNSCMIVFKGLELAWRRLWIRMLTRVLAQRRPQGVPEWSRARVLFLRHDRIGDMILSTGLLRTLQERHPGITIDVLASPANAPVLAHEPFVARAIVFRRGGIGAYPRVVRALRASRYDAVIDCMVTAPSLTTLLLMWASGARHRVGVAGRGNDTAYTLLVPTRPPGTHMAERLGALGAAFGATAGSVDVSPSLTLADAERAHAEAEWAGGAPGIAMGLRLLVNVSAGLAIRHWPDERYVEAVRRAAGGRSLNVIVIAAPSEPQRALAVARGLGGRAVATPDVRSAFALVATADAVLTPDTSIAHAASAFRRPAVAMYVHDTEAEWGLVGDDAANVVSPVRNLAALDVGPVADALAVVLRKADGHTARDL